MIIDVHVHCMSSRGPGAAAALVDPCRRNGVSLMLVSSIGRWSRYPPPEEVAQANDEARAFAEGSDGLARWLAYLNPQNDNWRAELERCLRLGPVGVKLWVSLKDAEGRLDNTVAVIRAAGERRLPVLIHTFQRTGPNLPGEITLAELATLAERCPEAALIGAHAGGNWRHSLGVLRGRAPNACVDISGCFPERGMVEALVGDIGADRILFGSDAPGRTVASQLAKVVFAGVPKAQKERILSGNALAVFGSAIQPGDPRPALPLRPASDLPDFRTEHFCFCGRWPFFRTQCETPLELDRLLAAQGIDRAYTGDLGSVYRVDIEQANAEFLESAREAARVAPLAMLSPLLHNWRQLIRSLPAGSAGGIVYPYLHNWRLDDPAHTEFFRRCAEERTPLWINCRFGDDRFRHSGLATRAVATDEVVQFAKAAPENAYVFQGLTAAEICAVLEAAADEGRFRFEISRLTDHTGALDEVLAAGGAGRLVMGSEFPLRDIRTVRWVAQRV